MWPCPKQRHRITECGAINSVDVVYRYSSKGMYKVQEGDVCLLVGKTTASATDCTEEKRYRRPSRVLLNRSRVPLKMNTCSPPLQFFVCTVNGFRGCCDHNPCEESQPICRMCSSTLGTGVAPALLPTMAGISEPASFVGPVTATGLPPIVLSEPWVPSSGYSGSVVSRTSPGQSC